MFIVRCGERRRGGGVWMGVKNKRQRTLFIYTALTGTLPSGADDMRSGSEQKVLLNWTKRKRGELLKRTKSAGANCLFVQQRAGRLNGLRPHSLAFL